MGAEWALASSLVAQSSLPVFESKARKRLSVVAPIKTSPAAVAETPADIWTSGRLFVGRQIVRNAKRTLPGDLTGIHIDGEKAAPWRLLARPTFLDPRSGPPDLAGLPASRECVIHPCS